MTRARLRSAVSNNDGKQVNGVFVSIDMSPTIGTSGQWDPTNSTGTTVALTQ